MALLFHDYDVEQAPAQIRPVAAPSETEQADAAPEFHPHRWRWPSLADKIQHVSINKDLKAHMKADPDVYNWVWCSIAVALQTREHTTSVTIPEHVREVLGLTDEEKTSRVIHIVKIDEGAISVMI